MKIIVGGNDFLALECTKWLIEQKENIVGIFSENRGNSWGVKFNQKAKKIAKELSVPLLDGNLNYYKDMDSSSDNNELFGSSSGDDADKEENERIKANVAAPAYIRSKEFVNF